MALLDGGAGARKRYQRSAQAFISAAAQATTYLSLKNCAQPYFIEPIESPTHGIDPFNPRIRLLGSGHQGREATTAAPPPANRTGPPPIVEFVIDHLIGPIAVAALAGTSTDAPFDVEAATDEPAGAGVLEKDVEAIAGPLSH